MIEGPSHALSRFLSGFLLHLSTNTGTSKASQGAPAVGSAFFVTIVDAERRSTWHRCHRRLWHMFQESGPVTAAMVPLSVPETWLAGLCEFLTEKQRSSLLTFLFFFPTFFFSIHCIFLRDLTCCDRSLGRVDSGLSTGIQSSVKW